MPCHTVTMCAHWCKSVVVCMICVHWLGGMTSNSSSYNWWVTSISGSKYTSWIRHGAVGGRPGEWRLRLNDCEIEVWLRGLSWATWAKKRRGAGWEAPGCQARGWAGQPCQTHWQTPAHPDGQSQHCAWLFPGSTLDSSTLHVYKSEIQFQKCKKTSVFKHFKMRACL